jgi:L-ascorbate metabolism protein UlaG (beta-lactamase superfamily)
LDEEFHSILLDDYVDDADNADKEITWHADGYAELAIQIVQRVVTITTPDAEWRGPETIQLTACDPGGLCDHAEVVCMVQEPDDLKITFVANAGFLIEAGEHKVAIDALLQPWAGYQSLQAADVSKMENARWPFDEVDLIFVTHDHFDHYAVDVLEAHLEQNSDSTGLSTQGVEEALRVIADDESLLDRMIGKKVRSGEKAQMIINEIGVELMHFPHGPGSPENLGVIFSIGGFQVLHTGDLNPDQTLDVLRNYQLSEKEIDVAMVPAFWLTISRYQEFLEEINARYFIPMHFDPAASSMLEEMQADFPQAIFFEKIYDTWTLQH